MKLTIQDVLFSQVHEILPTRDLLAKEMKKRKIRLYLGVDPTGANLHLGHAIPLLKLRQFQDLGHEVILLFGTFTARIGDPTGKDDVRKPLTEKEVRENMATYKKQAGKILDLSKTKIVRNGDWLGKLTLTDMLEIASRMTVSRLLERDMFQRRIKEGKEVWVHEMFYPLLQGYDSVAMDVDLEVGATDQTFNMLVGRKLQQSYHKKEKFVLTTPLLMGPDGRKMSKSLGNTIHILDTPNEMYGKVMSIRDDLILHYAELCANLSQKEVAIMGAGIENGSLHPREVKAGLAETIVSLYHTPKKAKDAEREFNRVFRDKNLPLDMPEKKVSLNKIDAASLLVALGLAPSKSKARQLIEQGGARVNGERVKDVGTVISPCKGMVVQVGKRLFARVA